MPLDPEDVIAYWAQRVERQTMLTTELSERLQQAKASAESPGGEALVTVDHSGGLANMRLSDRAMRMSPAQLAEIILVTSRRAQAELAQRVADVVKGLYGADSDTAAFIGGIYLEQFPEPEDGDQKRVRR